MNLRKSLVLCLFGLLIESGFCSDYYHMVSVEPKAQGRLSPEIFEEHFDDDNIGELSPGLLDTLAKEESRLTKEKEKLDQTIQFMTFDVGVVDTLLDMAKLCAWPVSDKEEFQIRRLVRQNQRVSEILSRALMCFLDLLPSLNHSGLSLLALIHFEEDELLALNSLSTVTRDVYLRKALVRIQAERLRALKEQESQLDAAPIDSGCALEEESGEATEMKLPETTELANCEGWFMIEDDRIVSGQPSDEELDPLGASMISNPMPSKPLDLFGYKRKSLTISDDLSSSGEYSLGIESDNPNRLRSLSSAEQLVLDEINREHQAEQDSGCELFLSLDSSLENQLLGGIRKDLNDQE